MGIYKKNSQEFFIDNHKTITLCNTAENQFMKDAYLMIFCENIYYSDYIRWIVLADVIWGIFALIFVNQRKQFKTDEAHFLHSESIGEPRICVTMPAYNEEKAIKLVVSDYVNQKYVESVIVVDNNSSDNTVKLAKENGAKVNTKKENKGFSHSYVLGLKESLKTDASVIVITESDGTFDASDISKLLP